MNSPLANRNVAVLGGTGSFGKAFVRRALEVGARRVVVFSRDELKQHELRVELADDRVRFMLGSVTDIDRVCRALRGVEYVVQAAALKQVPACEDNPFEALQTNAIGAQVVASACIEAGVERGIYLSTDKAAGPNTLYGATKLAGERIWTQANVYAAGTRTRFSATRYGNVLGSRGSVLPLWRDQVAAGEPVTVTDFGMTRFWMTLAQAVQLVETALAESRGGEVFVPKVPSCTMGALYQAVTGDLLFERSDRIGVRPGEKMHETLITDDEVRATADMGTHYVIEPNRTWEFLPPLVGRATLAGPYTSERSTTTSAEFMRALIEESGC